ncbi:MAG: hypothetical protein DHS20C12_00850 [Pseudohongiella sp.]|nr:MAG: hypothetical protein DHS20C12_00850 [Pseudohongiella sp.]
MPNDSEARTLFLIEYSRHIVAVFAALTLILAYFARDFEVDASAETLLVKNNPLYIQSKAVNQKFSPDEFLLIGFQPSDGDIFSAASLETIEKVAQEALQLERVTAVNSLISVPLFSLADGFSADIDADAYTWNTQKYDAETLRNAFTDHPIYTDLLVNEALTATAIQIVFEANRELEELNAEILALEQKSLTDQLSESETGKIEELRLDAGTIEAELNAIRSEEIATIYDIVDQHKHQGSFYLGGGYVLAEHLVNIIQNDLFVFGSAIGAIICALLLLLFRDLRWVFIPIICCLVSVVFTTGMFGLLGLKTTVISSNFIALQLILTLALVIHLIVQYQVLAQNDDGKSHRQLLSQTIRRKIRPCAYAGLTTSVGFGSLLFSGIQPVVSFGWMMIVAMITSILVSLILFPCILSLGDNILAHKKHELSSNLLLRVQGICSSYPRVIMSISVVIVGISILGILRLDVENSFLGYFKDSTQVSRELTFIDQELGGSTPLDIVYDSGRNTENADLVVIAEEIQTLQMIQESVELSEAVGKTLSIFNFTELAQELNNGEPLTEYELNSIYTILDVEIREKLIESYIDEESGDLRVSIRIKDSTPGLDRKAFMLALGDTMNELGIDENQYTLSNLFVLYQDILQRLYTSQITTLGLVYVALALVLLAIFRSFSVAVVALIPNIIATLFILGVMGLLSIPLDLMTITIAAIAMGIAVDDTIHFVHHYREKQLEAVDSPMQDTFSTVGYALLYTSLVIALGFSVLGFSDFVPSMLFGLLTALAMSIALITDLTLLPVLLNRFTDSKANN